MNLIEYVSQSEPVAVGLGEGMTLEDVELTGNGREAFDKWRNNPDNQVSDNFDFANCKVAYQGCYLTKALPSDSHLSGHYKERGCMPTIMTSEEMQQLVTAEVIAMIPNDFRKDVEYYDKQDGRHKEMHHICWMLWNKK